MSKRKALLLTGLNRAGRSEWAEMKITGKADQSQIVNPRQEATGLASEGAVAPDPTPRASWPSAPAS